MSPDERATTAWSRIEQALEKLQPGLSSKLSGGATAAALAALEERLGFALPCDVHASWLRHGGSELSLFGGHPLLTAEQIASEWVFDKHDPWPSYRVPLAGDSGYYFALEVAAAGAPAEHVVYVWREGQTERRASCWAELLEREAAALASGEITVEDGDLVRNDRPEPLVSGLELESQPRFLSEPPPPGDPSYDDADELVIEHNSVVPPAPRR